MLATLLVLMIIARTTNLCFVFNGPKEREISALECFGGVVGGFEGRPEGKAFCLLTMFGQWFLNV